MRRIEEKMLRAVSRRESWKEDNTRVVEGNLVYLFGNLIAYRGEDGVLYPNKNMFRSYPTRTTASRLNALGFDARIQNFRPVLNGEEL